MLSLYLEIQERHTVTFIVCYIVVNSLRPLFLRAFSIALPAVVFIRALNPETRAFLRLVPLSVLFVISILYFYWLDC